jgi:hypothetical protein
VTNPEVAGRCVGVLSRGYQVRHGECGVAGSPSVAPLASGTFTVALALVNVGDQDTAQDQVAEALCFGLGIVANGQQASDAVEVRGH